MKNFIERDKVAAVVGFTLSNVLLASMKSVVQSKTFLINTNPGTSVIAGKACSPYDCSRFPSKPT